MLAQVPVRLSFTKGRRGVTGSEGVCGLHCEAEELKLADPNHWPLESGRCRSACLSVGVLEDVVLHAYHRRSTTIRGPGVFHGP